MLFLLIFEFSTVETLVKDELKLSPFDDVKLSLEFIIESTKDFANFCISESFLLLLTLLVPTISFEIFVFLLNLSANFGSVSDFFGPCEDVFVLLLLSELSVVVEILDV